MKWNTLRRYVLCDQGEDALGTAPVTVSIDGQRREFCGIYCAWAYLDDVWSRWELDEPSVRLN